MSLTVSQEVGFSMQVYSIIIRFHFDFIQNRAEANRRTKFVYVFRLNEAYLYCFLLFDGLTHDNG